MHNEERSHDGSVPKDGSLYGTYRPRTSIERASSPSESQVSRSLPRGPREHSLHNLSRPLESQEAPSKCWRHTSPASPSRSLQPHDDYLTTGIRGENRDCLDPKSPQQEGNKRRHGEANCSTKQSCKNFSRGGNTAVDREATVGNTDRLDFATNTNNSRHQSSVPPRPFRASVLESIAPDELSPRSGSVSATTNASPALDRSSLPKTRPTWNYLPCTTRRQQIQQTSTGAATPRCESEDKTAAPDSSRFASTAGTEKSLSSVSDSNGRPSTISNSTDGVSSPTSETLAKSHRASGPATLDVDVEKGIPEDDEPTNPTRRLSKWQLRHQRLLFGSIVLALNATCIVCSAVGYSGLWVLVVILFFKSKDFFPVWIQIFCGSYHGVKKLFARPPAKQPSWILSLIPAYSESEEQIMKTLSTIRDNDLGLHRQVICIIFDGKPDTISKHMTKIIASFSHKYVSLKWNLSSLQIEAGFLNDTPIICIAKITNAGKKDSLVLAHDLFNYPRPNIPPSILRLRETLWSSILPQLTQTPGFQFFDFIYCSDADSTIHRGALSLLADALLADARAIAACGFVFVEHEPGREWSFWNLYQQFQYSFGQIVRRGAESYFGKVTCLPGCNTMIRVRPEMAGAMQKYAAPVTSLPVLKHQVQLLGTDRRLTYCLLSQDRRLRTLFVPAAGSETIAPQSLKHYLSQRRRWGSNAYFNNYFYFAGKKMHPLTRLFSLIDLLRTTMTYYRVANMLLFLYSLIHTALNSSPSNPFPVLLLIPLLVTTQIPTIFYTFCVLFFHPKLRSRWYKLLLGWGINRLVSPVLGIAVFSLVVRGLGSWGWGISGGEGVKRKKQALGQGSKSDGEEDRRAAVEEVREEERLDRTDVVV